MAVIAGIKLTGQWAAFTKAIDPAKFKVRIEREIRRSNDRIGREFVKRARQMIRAGAYKPNSPITVILKGSSKPLVHRGDLFQSITYAQPSWGTVQVGVFRAKAGNAQVNIGAILHEGATIDLRKHPQVRRKLWAMVHDALGSSRPLNRNQRVAVSNAARGLGFAYPRKPMTPRQRNAFFARQPKAPGTGKGVIVIPARPFIAEPLNDPTFVTFVRGEWVAAVKRALVGA